jgi:hypothetical protein
VKSLATALFGGSDWLAVVPGFVGAGWAGIALAGDRVLGYCGCGEEQKYAGNY